MEDDEVVRMEDDEVVGMKDERVLDTFMQDSKNDLLAGSNSQPTKAHEYLKLELQRAWKPVYNSIL